MTIRTCAPLATAALLAAAAPTARASLVDMLLEPVDQTVCVGDMVEVDLVLVSDGAPQPFDSLDAVLTWDPAVLDFIGSTQANAGVSFFLSGFLPDGDGINADLTDGDAIFTGLIPPGQTADAPSAPGSLVITTFQFQVVAPASPTNVQLAAMLGAFGQSRVLLAGGSVTGTLGPPAEVTAILSCIGDVNCDGTVDVNDLNEVIIQWGTNDPRADITDDGLVDVNDLVQVIIHWGDCP